jgi:homoserine kinase type II
MALLTPVSLDDARRLGAYHGLDIVAARPVPAGSVNTNVELVLAGGARAFLRVYEEQGAKGADEEVRLVAHLAAAGVPTPEPFPRVDGPGFVSTHAGKPAAVFPWIEGEVLCQSRVTAAAAAQVGAALARIHLACASFPEPPATRFGPAQLAARLASLRAAALTADLSAVVTRLEARLARLPRRAPEAGGWGLCHGDLFRDNVLWRQGSIAALLDFESASLESYPFDLMVTLLAWCVGDALDPSLARALAQGYAAVRPLPEPEAARLHAEGTFAALRFAVTRITDFELRPRGTGVYKDYRRFLARADALDALGSEGLRAMLGV